MFGLSRNKSEMIRPGDALPGRETPLATAPTHFVNGRPLDAPLPADMQRAMFAMGCFWGAERLLWQLDGVWLSAVGYAGGITPNPRYDEVCSGKTGHAEVVRVIFDPATISYGALLRAFWEGHDPTQGMRQGNDLGTQYRSALYTYGAAQAGAAEESKTRYQTQLTAAGLGEITTEIGDAPPFYFADSDHQQYLAKTPGGYCGLGGTGVSCPVGAGA